MQRIFYKIVAPLVHSEKANSLTIWYYSIKLNIPNFKCLVIEI